MVTKARPATLADLHDDCYPAMVRLATLLLDSQARAEEVVQDCFVRLDLRFDRIADPVDELRRAVVQGCRAAERGRGRGRHDPPEARPSVGPPGADALLAALAALPARQRVALVLRYYEDLSGPEIAALLGRRPGRVTSDIRRGLARLRKADDR